MPLQRTGPYAFGRLGSNTTGRLTEMGAGLRPVLDSPHVSLLGTGAVGWPEETGASWAPTPLPPQITGPADNMAREHDAVSVIEHESGAELHGGVSGAVPIYVDTTGGEVLFSSSIEPLVRTRAAIEPDWDGWAQMLAAGAPLGGRTTVAGIRRLRPWERITVHDDGAIRSDASAWPWLEYGPEPGANLATVAEELESAVAQLAKRGRLAPLLSGGWDSRILATLAQRATTDGPLTARTTSSDTGTVMEELIAAKVATHLGLDHRVLMPHRDQLGADVARFAETVDYQTSFHVWFVPVQRDLDAGSGTALDGLGGGLFLGGAFPDPAGSREPVIDRRFNRLTHYLGEAESVLAPKVIRAIRDRTRTGFEQVARPLLGHPFASTFTAYLNRTLPGISLAPYGLLAASTTVATPFLSDRVVAAALQLPPHLHQDGQLYPRLLGRVDPYLAELPTAEQLAPWPRPHPRRIASAEGARQIRDLVLTEPVRELIADDLAAADLPRWQTLLSTTRPQHLLRGLAVMSLWYQAHEGVLGGRGVAELVS